MNRRTPKVHDGQRIDDDWLTPTGVASLIRKSYGRARDMMLRGDFGPTQYDMRTRKLTVSRLRVLAWLERSPLSTLESTEEM